MVCKRRDLNLGSHDPKSDAISIAPQGLAFQFEKKCRYIKGRCNVPGAGELSELGGFFDAHCPV